MNHFSIFFMSMYVCTDTQCMSFPGTPALGIWAWKSCSLIPRYMSTLICSFPRYRMLAEESLVSFLMWAWHKWSTRTFCTLLNMSQYFCSLYCSEPLGMPICNGLSTFFLPLTSCEKRRLTGCLHLYDFHAHILEQGCGWSKMGLIKFLAPS